MNCITRLLVVGSLIIVCAGCATNMTSTYSPTSPAVYAEALQANVTVSDVTDKRAMEPAAYYKSFQSWDKANYDRSVALIVSEALETELVRAGAQVNQTTSTNSVAKSMTLKAEVLEYLADVQRPTGFMVSDVLNLKVALRFSWVDSAGKLLEENERSELVTRKLGVGKGPVLPYGSAEVKDYGAELMNTLLPRVIEKEIRLNKVMK